MITMLRIGFGLGLPTWHDAEPADRCVCRIGADASGGALRLYAVGGASAGFTFWVLVSLSPGKGRLSAGVPDNRIAHTAVAALDFLTIISWLRGYWIRCPMTPPAGGRSLVADLGTSTLGHVPWHVGGP